MQMEMFDGEKSHPRATLRIAPAGYWLKLGSDICETQATGRTSAGHRMVPDGGITGQGATFPSLLFQEMRRNHLFDLACRGRTFSDSAIPTRTGDKPSCASRARTWMSARQPSVEDPFNLGSDQACWGASRPSGNAGATASANRSIPVRSGASRNHSKKWSAPAST
jgi:hypothetical protein